MKTPKKLTDRAARDGFEQGDAIDVDAASDYNSTAVPNNQKNDWAILFDALDEFEPGFHLEREQPAS